MNDCHGIATFLLFYCTIHGSCISVWLSEQRGEGCREASQGGKAGFTTIPAPCSLNHTPIIPINTPLFSLPTKKSCWTPTHYMVRFQQDLFFFQWRLGLKAPSHITIKSQQIQSAQPYDCVNDSRHPACPKSKTDQIKIKETNKSPVYSADYTDRQRRNI